ncbi:hypothetical protein BDZ91DRAFT_301387 [Kalaharituber pfeilii]|nr:hypothetical protein BDZ91DRAFT_301387 [Kalaharituber pfeilii]
MRDILSSHYSELVLIQTYRGAYASSRLGQGILGFKFISFTLGCVLLTFWYRIVLDLVSL